MSAGLSSPLALFSLAILAGVFFGLHHPLPPVWVASISTGAALIAQRATRTRRGATVIVVALGAGVVLGSATAADWAADCRSAIADGAAVAGRGVVVDRWEVGARPARIRNVLLSADERPCRAGTVALRPPAHLGALAPGDTVTFAGTWRRTRAYPPGAPIPPERTGLVRAEHATLHPASRTALFDPDDRIQHLFPDHAGIAGAVALGRGGAVDAELRERFARAGLAHLLAVSGLHVGLFAAGIFLLGSVLRLRRRVRALATIGVIAGYVVLIGAPPSAVRAAIMIALVLLGRLLQRPAAPVPIVAFAALAMVAVDPGIVLQLGFQLSFAGVLGILIGRSLLFWMLPDGLALRGWRRGVLEGVVASAAAFLATAPVAAWHFGMIAPISVLSNLPATFFLAPIVFGIAASLVLDPLLPGVARFAADGTGLLLDGLVRWADLTASLPGSFYFVSRTDVLAGLSACAGGLLLVMCTRRLRPWVRAAGGAGSAVALVLLAGAFTPGRSALEIHFLDVGQGDATAVRTPADRWILIDAGPRMGDFDAGARRVLPYLRRRGGRDLALMVLTHPHLDHIGGAPAILRGMPTAAIADPSVPVASPAYEEVLALADSLDLQWIAARAGRTVTIDGIHLEFHWPSEPVVDAANDLNEISVVVQIRYGGFTALFTGDAYTAQEDSLVRWHGSDLRADVLQAGHHGSGTSSSAVFLSAVAPELIVVSAGRGNRYDHPAPSTLERMERSGADVARTDTEGTIVIRVPDSGERGWFRVR